MSEEHNKAIIRRLFEEVWSYGDLAAADELIDPNMVDHVTRPGNPIGPEGFKQSVTMFRSAFPDLEITNDDQIAVGDKVAVLWTARGTHMGELMGIAPTGKRIEVRGMYLYRLAGGKVVERAGARDMLGLMQQIGAIPTPG
jgi:predicted ester cyclase